MKRDYHQFSNEDRKEMFNLVLEHCPNSAFSLHWQGRRQEMLNTKSVQAMPDYLTFIHNNLNVDNNFLEKLHFDLTALPECCKEVLKELENVSVIDGLAVAQRSFEWKMIRKHRITGSTCYSIFTFKNQDWSKMIKNFFKCTNISTKEINHGIEQEAVAADIFGRANPEFDIKQVGIVISKKFPWLGYSPDGVIFKEGQLHSLLEIKCPYMGKFKTKQEVIPTLKYLKQDGMLKEKHILCTDTIWNGPT